MKFYVLTVITTIALSGSAFAQGVKLKKAWEGAEKKVSDAAENMKGKCGAAAKVEFDKTSFGTTEDMINAAGWCENAVNALSDLCSDKDYKDAVVKGVKTVTCKYDASLKSEAPDYGNKFELKNGTFTHVYNKDSANLWDRARTFAKDNL